MKTILVAAGSFLVGVVAVPISAVALLSIPQIKTIFVEALTKRIIDDFWPLYEEKVLNETRKPNKFEEVAFATREEAERVNDRLYELIEKDGFASVANLNELVGITGNVMDGSRGWTDSRKTGLIRIRNGFALKLPDPEPLI